MFFLSGKNKQNKDEILALKDKYKGRRCFIIGNGPSIKANDLEKLYTNKEITFAANKISAIFPKTSWRPTYYLVFDEFYQRNLIDVMSKTEAEKKLFDINSFQWTRKVTGNCIFLRCTRDRKLLDYPLFSDDIYKKIHTIATVTYVSIQIAVYMGFKELYLLGVDNTYSHTQNKDGTIIENKNQDSYFEGLENKDKKMIVPVWESHIAYNSAKEYADDHDIKIINATRGGQLEIFPRINFDALF
jgi:hypothetical protein